MGQMCSLWGRGWAGGGIGAAQLHHSGAMERPVGARPTAASPPSPVPHSFWEGGTATCTLTWLCPLVAASEVRPLLRPPAHLHSNHSSHEGECAEKLDPIRALLKLEVGSGSCQEQGRLGG